jgi:hypothetical protein
MEGTKTTTMMPMIVPRKSMAAGLMDKSGCGFIAQLET